MRVDRTRVLAGFHKFVDRSEDRRIGVLGFFRRIGRVNDVCDAVLHPSRHRQTVAPLSESLKRRVLCKQLRSERDKSIDLVAIHAEDQGLAAGKMSIERTRTNAGLFRNRVQRRIRISGEGITRHFENSIYICLRVGASIGI